MVAKTVIEIGAALLFGGWATVFFANNPPLANIGMMVTGVGLLTTIAGVIAWIV